MDSRPSFQNLMLASRRLIAKKLGEGKWGASYTAFSYVPSEHHQQAETEHAVKQGNPKNYDGDVAAPTVM